MIKIKIGDKVIILSGNYKGKIGIIKKIYPKLNKVIVSGINIVKKRIKPVNKSSSGNIIERESPLDISKVSILDITTGKPTRIKISIKDGKKERFLKRSGKYLDNIINNKKIS